MFPVAPPSGTAVRTIMLYGCGSNLEHESGMLTFNFKQILTADIPEEINFVVLTGGSEVWETEAEYLEAATKMLEGWLELLKGNEIDDYYRNTGFKIEGEEILLFLLIK